jgi:hypothetical protein
VRGRRVVASAVRRAWDRAPLLSARRPRDRQVLPPRPTGAAPAPDRCCPRDRQVAPPRPTSLAPSAAKLAPSDWSVSGSKSPQELEGSVSCRCRGSASIRGGSSVRRRNPLCFPRRPGACSRRRRFVARGACIAAEGGEHFSKKSTRSSQLGSGPIDERAKHGGSFISKARDRVS